MDEIPLGKPEGQKLEFKGRDSLKDLPSIGREVVGMLNAGGGEVWVGLGESEGVAVRQEPIEDVKSERRRLLDYLLDAIEPTPGAMEIEVRSPEGGPSLLCIQVTPQPQRRPYALLRKQARYFVTRVGDRLQPMARDEIVSQRRVGARLSAGDVEAAHRLLTKELREVQLEGTAALWFRSEPVPQLPLDLQRVLDKKYLIDPRQTGNRMGGFHFAAASPHDLPRLTSHGLVRERPRGHPGYFRLEILHGGGLTWKAGLHRVVRPNEGKEGRHLAPLRLVEMLTSLFRLLGAIYRDDELTQSRPDQNGIVLAMAALCGLGKAELRPGSPRVWDLYPGPYFPDDSLRPKTYDGGTDLVIQPPLQFYLLEITAEPDRCAYRLVRRIYECFGLGQEAIPREFDPKLGRLVLD